MSTREILQRSRKRLEQRSNWTKGAWARNSVGNSVDVCSGTACAWCLEGAIFKETDYDNISSTQVLKAIEAVLAATAHPLVSITTFNDALDTTHEQVLAVLDKAIELC